MKIFVVNLQITVFFLFDTPSERMNTKGGMCTIKVPIYDAINFNNNVKTAHFSRQYAFIHEFTSNIFT